MEIFRISYLKNACHAALHVHGDAGVSYFNAWLSFSMGMGLRSVAGSSADIAQIYDFPVPVLRYFLVFSSTRLLK